MLGMAAVLLIVIGIAHSFLGERYILILLFRRDNLPQLFGGTEFTKNTLRFAWHITSLAWFGFAGILFYMEFGKLNSQIVANIIGLTFLLHTLASLVGAKGKHFSWVFFLMISVFTFYAANG